MSAEGLVGEEVGGRYRITGTLGEGGMGSVFRVEHTALGRPFALKTLRVGERADELKTRFEREARALAQVRSARVAQVTDFGVDDRLGPWYVMELVEGESLHERLERGALPPEDVVRFGTELCAALADVHAVGIVHRDLKPSNIGLPFSGPVLVKLLDFGLAAAVDDAFLTRITQSQQVLGSLPYIAPEVFQGARPTTALDLWSLGIVLYEMQTGRLPFEAPSTAALMHSILTAPPPGVAHFPRPIATTIAGLLTKDPTHRIASAERAAEMLAGEGVATLRGLGDAPLPATVETPLVPTPTPIPQTMQAAARPVPPTVESRPSAITAPLPTRRWLPLVALGLVLAALSAVGAAWMLSRTDPAAEPPPLATAPHASETTEPPQSTDSDADASEDEPGMEAEPRTEPDEGADTTMLSPHAAATAMGRPRRMRAQPMVSAPPDTMSESVAGTGVMAAMSDSMAPDEWRGGIIEDL